MEGNTPQLVKVDDLRPAGQSEETCLRPLGLCELGGACEACWYRPDHPRFKEARRKQQTDSE
jgi:hypothetical protein